MRAIFIAVGLILFFALVYWIGMMVNFPGDAGSRYIESLVNRNRRIVMRMSPLELKWNRLVAERVALDALVGNSVRSIITFHDAEIPLSFGLFNGLTFRATTTGRGRLEGFWPWDESDARVDVTALQLAEVPIVQWLHPARIDGELTIRSILSKSASAQNPWPSAQIRGEGQNISIEGVEFMGVNLPATHLEHLGIQLRLGQTIDVEQFSLRGDIQGSIRGTVTPAIHQLAQTALNLDVELAFRPEWIDDWGDLVPILQAYLDQGRLVGTLRGTPARPIFRKSKQRR